MTRRYADGTGVSVGNSKAEIEKTVRAYADGRDVSVLMVSDTARSGVQFKVDGRVVQIGFEHPAGDDPDIAGRGTGARRARRSPADRDIAIDKEIRRRWRCVLLVIKSSFEIIQSGIGEFDQVFLPWILGPGDKTVWAELQPQIRRADETGAALTGLSWSTPLLEAGEG